ncbi:IclR family transcriptional regulator [Cytobacillus sp. NCCP-133]|uniref:IclR family transcriptional regulator n=1 Tax=Cytobacillus sp. NCCP-133 TaxID=766848 RepID=UPI00222F6A84|nr:IclR family transcriptional regulator [Cytobacillus sp. NCCP-133]GLB61827.1 HTH-type transcriptional regulator KipR [Cytobacillus sp. NCCP-133]
MNQSVTKALKLLCLFSEIKREISLQEMHEMTGMPKATAYRLLTSLEEGGLLRKMKHSEHDIRYRLGIRLLELGNLVSEDLELRRAAFDHMKALCKEINEVVHLSICEGEEAIYIEKVESNQAVRLYTRVGKRLPLYVGSGPKLLLANLPKMRQKEVISRMTFEEFTPQTITNEQALYQELDTIKEQGFAVSLGEQDPDTVGLSYPIRDYSGEVVGALGVTGPSMRFSEERKGEILEKTKKAAQAISNDLGFRGNGE